MNNENASIPTKYNGFDEDQVRTLAFMIQTMNEGDKGELIPTRISLEESLRITGQHCIAKSQATLPRTTAFMEFYLDAIDRELIEDVDYFHLFDNGEFVEVFADQRKIEWGTMYILIYASDSMAVRFVMRRRLSYFETHIVAASANPEELSMIVSKWKQHKTMSTPVNANNADIAMRELVVVQS